MIYSEENEEERMKNSEENIRPEAIKLLEENTGK